MRNHLRKLLLLALIIIQHTAMGQVINGPVYWNKAPKHRLTLKDRQRLVTERLEFTVDLGVGAFFSTDKIDSPAIDPNLTKAMPIPFGSLRVFYNLDALQLGLGYETGSLSIETMLPLTDAQTGITNQGKGRLYLASPFHSILAYVNFREDLNRGCLYSGILGGYMSGHTYSNIRNDYQPNRTPVAGAYFGITAGYVYFFRHVGIHLEYGLRVSSQNNGRQVVFMPFTIGVHYRNYPGFYHHEWRKEYKKPVIFDAPVML